MKNLEYTVKRRFKKNVGFPTWAWLLCLLLFLPAFFLMIIAHFFTEKVDMVEVEYKFEGDWFSTLKIMTLEEFEIWKDRNYV